MDLEKALFLLSDLESRSPYFIIPDSDDRMKYKKILIWSFSRKNIKCVKSILKLIDKKINIIQVIDYEVIEKVFRTQNRFLIDLVWSFSSKKIKILPDMAWRF